MDGASHLLSQVRAFYFSLFTFRFGGTPIGKPLMIISPKGKEVYDMEINIDTLINVVSLLIGGGGGAFFTWRWVRLKAKAEAEQAASTAAQAEQDVYQQIIADLKADRDDMKAYNLDVKKDRDDLRRERDELRGRIDKMEETIRQLQSEVAENGRQLRLLRPLVCMREGCKLRVCSAMSGDELTSKQVDE